MQNKLFVAGLDFNVTDETLGELFAGQGTVQSAKVVMDRDTGRSRGFGFVEMATEAEANAAVTALNGKDINGRSLVVNVAKPQAGGGGGGGRSSDRGSRY